MARQLISEGLKKFIRHQVQTVYRLEVLLLLHREQTRSFSAEEVAQELGFENDVALEQMKALAAAGLAVNSEGEDTRYRYHPANDDVDAMVEQLSVSYSSQRVPILSLILAERPDRIRLFAEAFRLIRGND